MLTNLLTLGATGGAGDVSSAMTTAFTSGAGEMKTMIATIAPIGIGVVVAGTVVIFGVKFFKRIIANS